MKRILLSLIFVLMLTSFASADIVLTQQPSGLYNVGDIVNLPTKIVNPDETSEFFLMTLLCNGQETEVHREYIVLSAGQEKEINPTIPLIPTFTGRITGTCKVKASLGEEYILTDDFKISSLITIESIDRKMEFIPGQSLIIEGEAKKENGKMVAGFVEVKIVNEDLSENIDVLDTVNNGYFYVNYSLPNDAKAGEYMVNVRVYEKYYETITNNGFMNYNVQVIQIPTSLEIVFENNDVEPGTNLRVKAILHDQTGEKIKSTTTISIKDQEDIVLEQIEKSTDEFFEFPIRYNEPSNEWKVIAISEKISNEASFEIIEKAAIKTELLNKTLLITNVGNIPYNNTILIKVGNGSVNVEVNLEVDGFQKYLVTAPNGEYNVEVLADGESSITKNVLLTGNAISVEKASSTALTLIKYPIVWIFIMFILCFVGFMIFKKGYKKSFFGYIQSRKKKKELINQVESHYFVNSKNRAELSLSIKGEKQDVNIICLKIKNFDEIKKQKGGSDATLQRIVDFAESKKAVTYENGENFFFMITPTKTKTFKNELITIEIVRKIKEMLNQHNKLFKQRIEYGIALNSGSVIAKQGPQEFRFMSLGTLITLAKKIARISSGQILLSTDINAKLLSHAKTEKHEEETMVYYTIKELKNNEQHKKFLNSFLSRLEADKKK